MTYGAVQTLTYDPVPSIIQEEKPKLSVLTTLPRAELTQVMAWILNELMEAKGKIFDDESEISTKTVFHSKVLPNISLKNYLDRFSTYSHCEDDVLIYSLIYLDRIGEKLADFTVDSFNVHK